MLEPLGIPAELEQLYVVLIADPGSSAASLAQRTGLPVDTVLTRLDLLTAQGLVVDEGIPGFPGHGPGDPARTFRASSPSVALAPLLLRQRTALEETGAGVAALAEQFRSAASRAAGGVVEVVYGPVGVRHRFAQLLEGARHEVLIFAPEAVVAVDRSTADPMERDALRRGVSFRTVLALRHLDAPGMLDDVRQALTDGMQVRVAEAIPMRLLISDRANAMLPLSLKEEDNPGDALVVHGTALVQALVLLFERYWDSAQPLRLSVRAEVRRLVRQGPTAQDQEILALLGLGLADRRIAAQLELSLRTVERRIRALLDLAQVESRFQLGLHAAKHGWMSQGTDTPSP
ncbi:winged helix-turn-helix transcriptional regulator [Streptacidiphilus sp. PAMC 29251]